MNPPINGKTYIWLNVNISIPLLLDSTSKTKFYVDEITISISNIPVYIISSFEGNMPEIHFYGNENTPIIKIHRVIRIPQTGVEKELTSLFDRLCLNFASIKIHQ